ncbi:FecR domain-containing protein [Calycomorphotria hydatis]|uniref:FecR protein n=1 Tax=Calycomorphotria hydatis TaxID=2528027 RepID=A0A517T4Y1_9PLAN|nr:FecR domain-containing protein [Calycomorphotria hydatis]QDT63443.1 FecR protein [Calycomorphotria hydatis]
MTDHDRSNIDSAGDLHALLNQVMNGTAQQRQLEELFEQLANDSSVVLDSVNHFEVGTALRESVNLNDSLTTIVSADRRLGRRNSTTERFRIGLIGAISALASVALAMIVGISLMLYDPAPPVAGKLVGLTADAKWAGKAYVPGDLILERMTATLDTGIASFELNGGAIVSIQGPSTIEATSGGETKLFHGLLHAVVPNRAIGYTVRTPDAEVVDHGTEFAVERGDEFGTRVVVKQGRVIGRMLTGSKLFYDLVAGQAMEFPPDAASPRELPNSLDMMPQFTMFEKARDGISRTRGIVRTASTPPSDLQTGQSRTDNFIMLIRERRNFQLETDLVIRQWDGPVTIPQGTKVDSYLLHFDPGPGSFASPVGAIDFHQPVLAVAVTTGDLQATDFLYDQSIARFPSENTRGLEKKDDLLEVSTDRKTLNFRITQGLPNALDQCRILVRSEDLGSVPFGAN